MKKLIAKVKKVFEKKYSEETILKSNFLIKELENDDFKVKSYPNTSFYNRYKMQYGLQLYNDEKTFYMPFAKPITFYTSYKNTITWSDNHYKKYFLRLSDLSLFVFYTNKVKDTKKNKNNEYTSESRYEYDLYAGGDESLTKEAKQLLYKKVKVLKDEYEKGLSEYDKSKKEAKEKKRKEKYDKLR